MKVPDFHHAVTSSNKMAAGGINGESCAGLAVQLRYLKKRKENRCNDTEIERGKKALTEEAAKERTFFSFSDCSKFCNGCTGYLYVQLRIYCSMLT